MNKQKGFIKILLIIIAVIAVSLFVYMRMGSRTEIIPSNVTDNKASSSLQSSEKDTTVDWKTYRNDKYGFEVKYPTSWKMQEYEFRNDGNVVNGTIVDVGFDPLYVISQTSFETMDMPVGLIQIGLRENQSNSIAKENYENLKTVEISKGVNAKILETKTGEDGPNPAYYNTHTLKYYLGNKTVFGDFLDFDIIITYVSGSGDQYLNIFDEILSTFKFIK